MKTTHTPMMQQYLNIKKDHKDAILFFRLGDFYEMFFEDAEHASKALDITLTSRESSGIKVPMCGIPAHSSKSYIQKLINKGFKVAICEQTQSAQEVKGIVRREVVRTITPGTVIEDEMLNSSENNYILSTVKGDQNLFSIVLLDISTGEILITQVEGEDNLYREISLYNPSEILLESKATTLANEMKKQYKTMITLYDYESHSSLNLQKQFSNFEDVCQTPLLKYSLSFLYDYICQTNKNSLHHLKKLKYYDSQNYMVLDNTAVRNLELVSNLSEGKKYGSLLWLLDQTVTSMGSRVLRQWLLKPLLDVKQITQRQEFVGSLLDDIILLDKLRDSMRSIYDIERIIAKISCNNIKPYDLINLKKSLAIIPSLLDLLHNSNSPNLIKIAEVIDSCSDIAEFIANSIQDEPSIHLKDGNVIKDGFNNHLDELRDIQKNSIAWLAALEQTEREKTGIKNLKINYNKVFGYFIEISKGNLKHLSDERYIRKQTLTNCERFVTEELKNKEQMILSADENALSLEASLFETIRQHLCKHITRIQLLSEVIAKLDILQSFAKVASKYNYICPKINETKSLVIKEGRHPVVEALTDFIANDVEITLEKGILLITGPNMAGKSTYMRQIALITILAQLGSFVPATYADISIVDRIFTRIGAADDLIGGRSTFMVEMIETHQALDCATDKSLILLDEIGRGTSTYDGIAIAQSIVEYIHNNIGCKTLFSTHYHELINLEQSLTGIKNLHAGCLEKNGQVTFLYKMQDGGADKSYGIHVAELAGLPIEIIDRAKSILEELEYTG